MRVGQAIRWMAVLLALTLAFIGGVDAAVPARVRAFAEEAAPELEISVLADPDNPSAADEIALSFSLTNRSEERITGILLATPEGQQSALEETVEPGETLSFTQVHEITQAELEAGAVSYLVTCEMGSGRFSYPAVAELNRAAVQPEVEFLRRVSGRSTSDGTVTLVYEVRNVGAISVQGLTVADPLGSFSAQLERLEAGETRSWVSHVTLSGPASSVPELSYSAAASPEDVYSVRLDELSVSIADEALNLILTAGRSMFAENTAEVALRLTNVGNTDYPNLTIYDELYGGIIADSISLPAGGEAVEVTHSYPIRDNERYCWRVVGASEAGGQLNQLTNTVTVPVESGGAPELKLIASSEMTRISRRGYVPFTLTLANLGSGPATHVQIYEQTLGELCELAVVSTGEPTVRTEKLLVNENTTFQFYAVYSDADGRTYTVSAEPVEVVIAVGGARPESGETSQQSQLYSGLSMQLGSSSLFLWLLGGSCAILVVLSIVLFVTSRRVRKERKERAAARKQRIKEEMGKTNPFRPVRQNTKKQGK